MDMIRKRRSNSVTRIHSNVSMLRTKKYNISKKYFFLSSIFQWNKLDINIRNSESLTSFKSNLQKFTCPIFSSASYPATDQNTTWNWNWNWIDSPLFFLDCHNYITLHQTLLRLRKINNFDSCVLNNSVKVICKTILYGDSVLKQTTLKWSVYWLLVQFWESFS